MLGIAITTALTLYATALDGTWETDYMSRNDGWFVKVQLNFSEGQATISARAVSIPPMFPHSCDIVQKGRYTATEVPAEVPGVFDVDVAVESVWLTVHDPESTSMLNDNVFGNPDRELTTFLAGIPKQISGFSTPDKAVVVAQKGHLAAFRLQVAEDKLYAPAFWIPGIVKAVPSSELPPRATDLAREVPFFRKN